MELSKLFEIQAKLDKHIVEEKGLEGKSLLDDKILALQVELGELANEWRGFKFWSEKKKPKILESSCADDKAEYFECGFCNERFATEKANEFNYECPDDENTLLGFRRRNTVLEEYVDCLHFILSIGLDLKQENWKPYYSKVAVDLEGNEITTQFHELFRTTSFLKISKDEMKVTHYGYAFADLLGLGEMLGFSWEQIEQAYLDKNKVNHERQQNGY